MRTLLYQINVPEQLPYLKKKNIGFSSQNSQIFPVTLFGRIEYKSTFISISGGLSILQAMKQALGDIIDPSSMQAMEVGAVMAQAGATKEEIEEMMALLLSQGSSGVSADFLDAVKEAMQGGGLLHLKSEN